MLQIRANSRVVKLVNKLKAQQGAAPDIRCLFRCNASLALTARGSPGNAGQAIAARPVAFSIRITPRFRGNPGGIKASAACYHQGGDQD